MPVEVGTQRHATLDVVIVNWNTGEHLRACLDALVASSRSAFDFGKVIVVDNASRDGSLDGIDDLPLPLSVIRNEANCGFAAACNEGAAEGSGDFVLFLNPDTRVFSDAIDRSVGFMIQRANARVGISGGRMIGDSGQEEFSCARFPTLWMYCAKMLGLAHLFPQQVPRQRIEANELPERGPVDQVIGAYFLIRRELFAALGGFDERFFVYLEEVDLAFRARALGFACYFLSDVRVHHVGHVSSGQVHRRRLYYMLRGRTEYGRKHWPRWQVLTLAALTSLVEVPARCAVAAVHRDWRGLAASLGAAVDYLRYLFDRGAPVPRC
jgi:N-acetylglucosaminyl-diphospho-decaprenol L-rhamnosyltransferase